MAISQPTRSKCWPRPRAKSRPPIPIGARWQQEWRGSGVVCYTMQVAVDTVNHLIVRHEVTNIGSNRSQLANVAREANAVLQVDKLEAIADRGYFNGEEMPACEQADICVTLPKPLTSGAKLEGRFGKPDFRLFALRGRRSLPSRAAAEVLLHRRLNGGKRGRGTGTDH